MTMSYDGNPAPSDDAWDDLPWNDDVVIHARDGARHDLTGDVWILEDPTCIRRLDWIATCIPAGPILEAAKEFVRLRIEERSYASASGEFHAIRCAAGTAAFALATATMDGNPDGHLGTDVALEMIDGGVDRVRITRWRYFYRWAARMDDAIHPPRCGFDRRVAAELDAIALGRHKREMLAVLRFDPYEGPLIDVELQALVAALSHPIKSATLDLQERVALWLCLSLGTNAGPLALLRSSDLVRLGPAHAPEAYFLRIPRQKKQEDEYARKSSKLRRLEPVVGSLVAELVDCNRKRAKGEAMRRASWAMPLFLAPSANEQLSKGDNKAYTMHLASFGFSELVRSAAAKLRVVSPRTGALLHVRPRRLRHTFATNLALLGVPAFAIAEGLDHSSLNTVAIYVDNARVLQERTDAALAEYMNGLVDGFLGRLHRDEAAAGGSAADRIYADLGDRGIAAVGTCGSKEECRLAPPVSCYTCRYFRPWLHAPHDGVLAAIDARADRLRAAGATGRLVGLHADAARAIRNLQNEVAATRATEETASP